MQTTFETPAVQVHTPDLTASEVSQLWVSYQNETMAVCGIRYFLQHAVDPDIRSVLEYALSISEQHVRKVTQLFEAEQYPVPVGFTEADVNLKAPRLFSDRLCLLYALNMGKYGLAGFSLAVSFSSRKDIVEFYSACLAESNKLHNMAKDLLIRKGIYLRPAQVPSPAQASFVEKQSFLAGWLGERRPLLGMEMANLLFNVRRNVLGEALIQGFAQCAENKKVRQYFQKGKELASKHTDAFSAILRESNMTELVRLVSEVTDSMVSPFSDKLMMFHISGLIASGIGQYGVSMSMSPRRDLGMKYGRLSIEIAQYAEEGAKIMIDHGWLERPPQAADRKALVERG